MIKKRLTALVMAAVMAMTGVSVFGASDSQAAKKTGIRINHETYTLNVRESVKLKVMTSDKGIAGRVIKWKSSRKSVADVNKKGVVKARKKGTANITASVKGTKYTSTCRIYVGRKVSAVKAVSGDVKLTVGESSRIRVKVLPGNAANRKLAYTSGDNNIVRVNSSGKVTAVSAGTAVVAVSSTDGTNKVSKIKVTVADKTAAADVPAVTADAALVPAVPTTVPTAVTTTAPTETPYVTECPTQTPEPTKEPETEPAATPGPDTTQEPTRPPVSAVSLKIEPVGKELASDGILDIDEAEEVVLKVVFTPDDTTDKSIEWSSTDENVVTVDKNGRIKGIAQGYAYIKAVNNASGLDAAVLRVCVGQEDTSFGMVIIRDMDDPEGEALDSPITMYSGTQLRLSADVRVLVSEDRDKYHRIKWSSSNEAVATVDDKGVVKTISSGLAIITALNPATGLKEMLIINVSAVRDIITDDEHELMAELGTAVPAADDAVHVSKLELYGAFHWDEVKDIIEYSLCDGFTSKQTDVEDAEEPSHVADIAVYDKSNNLIEAVNVYFYFGNTEAFISGISDNGGGMDDYELYWLDIGITGYAEWKDIDPVFEMAAGCGFTYKFVKQDCEEVYDQYVHGGTLEIYRDGHKYDEVYVYYKRINPFNVVTGIVNKKGNDIGYSFYGDSVYIIGNFDDGNDNAMYSLVPDIKTKEGYEAEYVYDAERLERYDEYKDIKGYYADRYHGYISIKKKADGELLGCIPVYMSPANASDVFGDISGGNACLYGDTNMSGCQISIMGQDEWDSIKDDIIWTLNDSFKDYTAEFVSLDNGEYKGFVAVKTKDGRLYGKYRVVYSGCTAANLIYAVVTSDDGDIVQAYIDKSSCRISLYGYNDWDEGYLERLKVTCAGGYRPVLTPVTDKDGAGHVADVSLELNGEASGIEASEVYYYKVPDIEVRVKEGSASVIGYVVVDHKDRNIDITTTNGAIVDDLDIVINNDGFTAEIEDGLFGTCLYVYEVSGSSRVLRMIYDINIINPFNNTLEGEYNS